MWHNWSRKKRWLISSAGVVALGLGMVTGGLSIFLHIPSVPLPAGVSKSTQRLSLAGKVVSVDFYIPSGTTSAPVVVVAHGFSRNRRTMAGWGSLLAKEGFLVVVPDLPSWADHGRNGRALTELLAEVQSGKRLAQLQLTGPAALVGFSAGGFSSLLAAASNTNVTCWIGLDPVGMDPLAGKAAGSLKIPAFVLRSEPAPWNAQGNARQIFAKLSGPAFSLVIKNASHVDAEYPTSRAADWACGQSDPARRERYGHYLLASLRASLLGDGLSLRQLHAATNDIAVGEVEFRKAGDLLPPR